MSKVFYLPSPDPMHTIDAAITISRVAAIVNRCCFLARSDAHQAHRNLMRLEALIPKNELGMLYLAALRYVRDLG